MEAGGVVSIACCWQAPSPGTDLLGGRGGYWLWSTWLGGVVKGPKRVSVYVDALI